MPTAPRLPTSERIRRAGITAWSLIGIVIVLVMFVYVLLKIRIIFPPLVLALLLIYLLNPLVTRFEERGVPRLPGTLAAFTVFIGCATLLLMLVIPYVSRQVQDLSERWPEFREKTVMFVDDTAVELQDRFGISFNTTQIDCLLGADQTAAPGAPSDER